MKSSLTNIGSKKAVVIPEDLLEHCNIIDKVFIEIESGSIVIRSDSSYKEKVGTVNSWKWRAMATMS
jgi:hypothetical protein